MSILLHRLSCVTEINFTGMGPVMECFSRPRENKPEGFSFPEELLPACTQMDSSVTLMTLVNFLSELLHAGGSSLLIRKMWGCFRATLGLANPLYNLNWSRAETSGSLRFYCSCQLSLYPLKADTRVKRDCSTGEKQTGERLHLNGLF